MKEGKQRLSPISRFPVRIFNLIVAGKSRILAGDTPRLAGVE